MTYRIHTITYDKQIPEQRGWQNAVLIREWGEKTNYQPEPGAKLVYGVPPWGHVYLWEIDAPFPVGANPPSPEDMEYSFFGSMIFDDTPASCALFILFEFLAVDFPDQLP